MPSDDWIATKGNFTSEIKTMEETWVPINERKGDGEVERPNQKERKQQEKTTEKNLDGKKK